MQIPGSTRFVVAFAREEDARQFARALPARLAKFGLELASEKTRLMPFGRRAWYVAEQHSELSARFDFLGFTHFGARSRTGHWVLQRRPTMKSRRKFLVRVKSELHRLMHAGVLAQQRYLQQALRGFNGYFGYPGCTPALETIRYQVSYAWYQVLRRRSQRSHRTKSWYFSQRWFRLPGATLRPRRTMAR